jgi:hypothetical protein
MLIAAVGSGAGARLATLLEGIDPDDAHLVDLVARPVEAHLAEVRELLTLLVRNLAFAEAVLVDADFVALGAGLSVASVALSTSALAPVDGLVRTMAGFAQPLLDVEVPALGRDTVWGASDRLAGQLEAAVTGLAPSALGQVTDPLLDAVLTPVRAVREALDELSAVFATLLDPIRQALRAVDLAPVAAAIHTVVGPVSDAVDAVRTLVEDTTAEVQDVVAAVDGLLEPARAGLRTARDALAEPFTAVSEVLAALDLAALNERVRSTLGAVTEALAAAPVQPVFDVATGVISTTAGALGLVPKALLPDDLKAALEAACAPVEAIDLEPVRAELHARLQAVVDGLDTTALDALEAGFAEVQAFVASIDPRPHLVALEQDAFATLVDGLNQLDPSVVLAPLTEALSGVKDLLDGIDVDELVRPLDEALDEVVSALDQVDPAQLLAPVAELLDGVQEQVASALGLATLVERIDAADEAVTAALAGLDPAPIFADLQAGWAELVGTLRPGDGGTGLAATLVGALLGGLPFPANSGGIGEVMAWIRGERDGTAVARARLAQGAGALERARAGVEAIDVRALTAELDAGHRALVAAVEAHPADSVLRARLDPSVLASAPTASVATVLTNIDAVRDAIGSAANVAGALAAPDRSEVGLVAAGLAVSFAPLAPVTAKGRSLLAAVGAEPGTDPRDALADLLISLGPSAVLGPFEAVATSLASRLVELVRDGLFAPLRDGVHELQAVLDALDLDNLTGGLATLHQELVATVDGLRPAVVLAEPIGLLEDLKTTLATFDPFAPVQAAIDALGALVTGFVDELAPTVVLAPVLGAYDQVAALVGGFDVTGLLEPVRSALAAIGGDIDRGMDGVIDALGRLQQACESDGGPIPGLDLSIAVSVTAGGGFGL